MKSTELNWYSVKEFWKGYGVTQNHLTGYEPVSIKIQVGTEATLYVGTDSYATKVTAITYFKSGVKQGRIKSIKLDRFSSEYTAKVTDNGIFWKGMSGLCQIGFGYQETYRDPHI